MNPIAILTIAFAAPLVSCVSYHEPIDNRGFASAETPKRRSAPIANLIASGSSGVQWSDAGMVSGRRPRAPRGRLPRPRARRDSDQVTVTRTAVTNTYSVARGSRIFQPSVISWS